MIVRDTPWDERALGLPSMEICAAETDSDEEVLREADAVRSKGRIYCVMKFPLKRVELAHALEEKGFRFLEAQSDLHKNLSRDAAVEPYLLSAARRGSFTPVCTAEDLSALLNRLDGVFDSDRISLDPAFGKQVSLQRYRGWIEDRFGKDGAHIAWITADGVRVGFFFLEQKGDAADSALAGLFPEFKGKGYGPLIISAHMECAKNAGVKKLVTRVSLNNLESLRLHLAFGYQLAGARYVMRYKGEGHG
jgi:GNAT superfamily N-acetyltransferase